MPRDATRATLIALGLSLAGQACGGQIDGDNDRSAEGAGASVGMGAAGTGSGGAGGRSDADRCQEDPLAPICHTAPYGASPLPRPAVGGSAGNTGISRDDAGAADAGTGDVGSIDGGPSDAGG